MSTELETYSAAVETSGYTHEQLDLIKRTFAAGTNDLEFALFMETANRTGLSPLAKQIYAVKRWSKKDKREVMSIQTGIDGYRLIADRTGQYDGHDGPFWCGPDGVWREVWFDNEPPKAAKVVVYKRGSTRGFPGVAHWREYVQLDRDENPTRFWANMPATMLAKCAESLALRKAFPQELSGLYTVDEMGQADQESGPAGGTGKAPVGSDQTPELVGPPSSKGGLTAPTPDEPSSQESGAAAIGSDDDMQQALARLGFVSPDEWKVAASLVGQDPGFVELKGSQIVARARLLSFRGDRAAQALRVLAEQAPPAPEQTEAVAS
jgi:phage recombination protein Bet